MRKACVIAVVALLGLLFVQPALAGYRETVLASNPDAYWPFDEESGATGVDLVAGNDATHRAPGEFGKKRVFKGTVTSGVAGAQFPGNDQFPDPGPVHGFAVRYEGIHNGSDSQYMLPTTSEVTFELSLKSTADRTRGIVGGRAGNGFNTGVSINFPSETEGIGGDGSVWLAVDNANEPSFGDINSSPDVGINDGEWHHIVTRWKGPSTEAAPAGFDIFVDGVKLTDVGARSGPPPQETFFESPTYFGVNQRSGTVPPLYKTLNIFDGDLDEISIYTRALSDAEVLAHWQAWIPEPATLALLGGGGLLLLRRRRA